MALNSLGLGFVFSARDLASPTMAGLTRNFGMLDRASDRFGQTMRTGLTRARTAGLAMAAMGGIGTIASFALARAAGEFEQGLARVAGVTGATTAELEALRQRAIQVGIDTSFSPDQAVSGLSDLAEMGFNASESMTLIGPATALAEGGMIQLGDAATAVASATRVFSLDMDEAAGSAYRLLRISQLTALQAGDLSLALGTVARGAGQTRQNLDEMLVAMGLVRNTGVETSVAASSVSSALQQMAMNASDIRQQLGVSVTDADGNFRNFLDIVVESSAALGERFPNAADRAATTLDLFGRFGVTAFNSIERQLEAGVRGASGEMLRQADAVAYLRAQMANAEGTARQFQDRMLNTFPGQLVLLRGSLQTLAVVLGENFARAFRPAISGVIRLVNALIAQWNELPVELRDGIAAFIVGMSLITTAIGTVVAMGASLGLLALAWEAIAAGVVAVGVAILPVIAGFAVAAGAVQTLRFAIRNNLGGIGTFVQETVARIQLGWTALRELFTRGGFTRAVSEELSRAENSGVRNFVISVYGMVYRLQRLWEGFTRGLTAGILAARPSFERLTAAFERLGSALGIGSTSADELGRSLPSNDFVSFGERAGLTLATVVELLVDAVTWLVDVGASAIETGKEIQAAFTNTGALSFMPTLLAQTWFELNRVRTTMTALSEAMGGSGADWATFGALARGAVMSIVAGWVIMLTTINNVLNAIGNVISGLERGVRIIQALHGALPPGISMMLPTAPLAGIDATSEGDHPFQGEGIGGRARGFLSRARDALFGDRAAAPGRDRDERQGRESEALELIANAMRRNQGANAEADRVLRAVINVDGRRLQEVTARTQRSDDAARGRPVDGDS